jgi:REP element-mobilizing transposase RayT
MTAPRQVLPGTTYLITRRCTQRQFLLKPSKVTTAVFGYLLAVAAKRYGVEVHAYCVLSNHYHLVITDPQARLPAFQQFLDALVARAVNAHLGRWENFWATSSFNAVALASAQDVVDKAAYVLANPVAARLVRTAREWPGLWSSPRAVGGEVVFRRPKHFFAKKSCLPESVGLTLAVPPGFLTAHAFREALEQALASREAEAAQVGDVLGVERVLAQSPFAKPKSGEPRRKLSPRVAARDKWGRIELLGRLKDFVAAYREALAQWCDGKRATVFPAGTYLMRVAHGVACAGAG